MKSMLIFYWDCRRILFVLSNDIVQESGWNTFCRSFFFFDCFWGIYQFEVEERIFIDFSVIFFNCFKILMKILRNALIEVLPIFPSFSFTYVEEFSFKINLFISYEIQVNF